MMQGSSSYPRGQEYYQSAVDILSAKSRLSPETAWALDKLSAAKHAAQDYPGAADALGQALNIWRMRQSNTVDQSYLHAVKQTSPNSPKC